MTKTKGVIAHVKKRGYGGTSWNALYNKFGAKKVNKAIKSGRLYSGMNGRPAVLN